MLGPLWKEIFFVKFTLCNKSDCFKWALVAVYGPTQVDKNKRFLVELVGLGSHASLHIVIGVISYSKKT